MAFGKEVAIWTAFGVAGELAASGRVALSTGFRSIEIWVARSPAGQLGIHAAW